MRRFNIAGPCRVDRNYMIPPERRIPELTALVDNQAYFVVHAPRQTGKTTIEERTRFGTAHTASGRAVTVLRA